MELLVLVIALVAFDLLALRFGHDSRDDFSTMARSAKTSSMGWSDSTYDRELALEIQEVRQRRLAQSQVADTPLHQAHDELSQAA